MGATYIIEDTGETEWAWYSAHALVAAWVAGAVTQGAGTAAMAALGYRKYNKFTISYKRESGDVVTKTGIYGQKPVKNWDGELTNNGWPKDIATTAEQSVKSSPSADGTDNNHLRFWELAGNDDDGWYVKEDDVDKLEPYWAMRGGMPTEEPVEEEVFVTGLAGDQQIAMPVPGLSATAEYAMERVTLPTTPHTTLSFSSMSDTTGFSEESGLIRQGSFALKWNDFSTPKLWSTGVKLQYVALQGGNIPGSIAVIRENIYLPPGYHDDPHSNAKTFNMYYDLNTGAHQKGPTYARRRRLEKPTFRVLYGDVEHEAPKYKRFEGTYSQGMDFAIDSIVQTAIKTMRTKSRHNFKKIDTNQRFRKRNLSLFSKETQATETVEVSTMTTMTRGSSTMTRGGGTSGY